MYMDEDRDGQSSPRFAHSDDEDEDFDQNNMDHYQLGQHNNNSDDQFEGDNDGEVGGIVQRYQGNKSHHQRILQMTNQHAQNSSQLNSEM